MKQGIAYSSDLRAPVNVTWEITGRCNLACTHCLSADIRGGHNEDLDLRECRHLIDELDRLKVFQINFGGGEPFLRDDFLEILDYAHSKGITTCVSTNGTVFEDKLVSVLKSMDLLYIQVSLDGATAETNDQIRGDGTYERILDGIALLARHGIRDFSINTVVTKINFKEIGQLTEIAKGYGAKTRLSRFRPTGNGKGAWEAYHLDKAQLLELSTFLSAHRNVLTGDSFFSITSEDRRDLGLNMCGAAKMTCSISPDGTVYPCAFLQESFFMAGNVRKDSFERIWRESGPLVMIRSLRIESCEYCPRFNMCHGGCPAVAYFLTRSLHHPDPECMTSLHEHFATHEYGNEVLHHGGTI